MRLLLEAERKEWKRGVNGNESFWNRLIEGAYRAHMQSSVKFLDFPGRVNVKQDLFTWQQG